MRVTSLVVQAVSFWLLLLQHAVCVQVTGASTGITRGNRRRPFRLNVIDLSKSGPTWDLYIQALDRFQQSSVHDPLSYFQVAGIHGYPQQPWDNVAGRNPNAAGYCMHSSVNFATWHRPYLALFEQIMSHHAQDLAREYPLDKQAEYSSAADLLRIPYWDWGHHFTLPDVVTAETLSINTSNGTKLVRNPLLEYRFPIDMVNSHNFPSGHGQVAMLNRTARHCNFATGESDQGAASAELNAHSAALLSNLYQLFAARTNWASFSPYMLADVPNNRPNLESVHGDIHNHVGGLSGVAHGHMTDIALSSFDPVFWLHHANVDRITAMWQAVRPDSFVLPMTNTEGSFFQPAYTLDTEDSPLAPFRIDLNGTMWTAKMARDTAAFGYTYPELIDWDVSPTQLAASVRQRINELYNPSMAPSTNRTASMKHRRSSSIAQVMSHVQAQSSLRLGVNNLDSQYYVRMKLGQRAAREVRTIYIFVGNAPSDAKMWPRAANLIGSYRPYFGDRTCTSDQDIDIPCTHTVAAAVDRGVLSKIHPDVAVPFLRQQLDWKMVADDDQEIDCHVTSSDIQLSIVERSVQPRTSIIGFPSYGKLRDHGRVVGGPCKI